MPVGLQVQRLASSGVVVEFPGDVVRSDEQIPGGPSWKPEWPRPHGTNPAADAIDRPVALDVLPTPLATGPMQPPIPDERGFKDTVKANPAINSKQRAVPPVLQSPAEPDAVTPVRDEAAPGPRIAGVAKPTRITVDLAADLHSFLRAYAQARDVAAADVIRELIRQVRADPDLSARVTAELARRREALAEAMRAARE